MSSSRSHPGADTIRTVLFDLDGTLLDTAPDLADALNRVLEQNGRQSLPYENIRPVVSHGGIALIELGFGLAPGDPAFDGLRKQLLDTYRENISRKTRPFPGITHVLERLEERGINWGIVTNKPGWLTDPLLRDLGLYERAACVVSGDTLSERKPHPAPMLHACEQAGSRRHNACTSAMPGATSRPGIMPACIRLSRCSVTYRQMTTPTHGRLTPPSAHRTHC